jgi:tight adherence protein C
VIVDSDVILLVGLAGIFLAIVIALTTVGVMTSERQQISRSLAAVEAIRAAPVQMQQELNAPFADRVIAPLMARFTRLGRRFTAEERLTKIRQRLEVAGNPPRWDVDRVLALKVLGLLVGAVLGLAMTLAL